MTAEVADLFRRYLPDNAPCRPGRLITDTTNFMSIDAGDVMVLGGKHYLVLRDEAERRFGMEDPKFWVKRCRVLESGQRAIVKLVFHESFLANIGDIHVRCYRSPAKEARILDLVRGDTRFMQGFSVEDEQGNNVRVLDVIRGKRLDVVVEGIDADHHTYFFRDFPAILGKFIGSCQAIGFLHDRREKHGDIRRDHLWVESGTGAYRWIDFDYAFDSGESPFGFDLLGLGNILLFLAGKGIVTTSHAEGRGVTRGQFDALEPGDFGLVHSSRVCNLRKIYPYIPDRLNRVLMHFSKSTEVFYETVDELLEDLRPVEHALRG